MITRIPAHPEVIKSATCDCCGRDIKNNFGHLEDHMEIGGYQDGKLLEAIVCIPCVTEKLQFINIQRKENTIGHC